MEVCRSGRLHEEEEEEEVLKLWEEDGEVVLAHPLGSNHHHHSIGVVGEPNFLTPDSDFSLFSDFGGVEWLPGFGCEEDALSCGRAKIRDSPFFLTEEEEEEDGEGEEEDKGKNTTTSMSALQSRIHARLRSKRRRAKRGQKWGFNSFSDNLALLSFTPVPSLHAPLLSAPSTITSDHTLKDSEFVRQAPSDHHYSAPEQFSSSSSLPLLSTLWPATLSAGEPQSNGQLRRCTHCLVQKTPQWRAGPRGPKTLCNACGVRFKSGRLYPEYRPAKSPTFDLYSHSNSHKKVTQMRRLKGLQTARPPMQATMHGHHLGATREVAQG